MLKTLLFKPSLSGAVAGLALLSSVLGARADELPVVPPAENGTVAPPTIIAADRVVLTFPAKAPLELGTPKLDTIRQGDGPGVALPLSGLERLLAPRPKPRPEEAHKVLAVVRNNNACKTRLDISVEKASLEEIAAQVKKALGENAPQIVVRDASPIRLSFALKDATVKEALETTGGLAGVKLWVLSDHLLLAPQTALTPDETESLADSLPSEVQRVLASLLADEVKAKLGGKAAGTATKTGEGAKVTFGMLSPEGQEMLLGLFSQTEMDKQSRRVVNKFNGVSDLQASPTLSPATVIQLNPQGSWRRTPDSPDADIMSIKEGIWQMHWATSGDMSGGGYGLPPTQKSVPSVAPPLFDLSSKKS